ncbi:SHOCT domain-containing protein [Arthrobacter sp. ISL-85]|nr:SHOCT domain-containing protein [Arthrobacter sp. ISL-85]
METPDEIRVAADLARLADLHSRGALSSEEFSAARRRILES